VSSPVWIGLSDLQVWPNQLRVIYSLILTFMLWYLSLHSSSFYYESVCFVQFTSTIISPLLVKS
jgi:hypothetical protein